MQSVVVVTDWSCWNLTIGWIVTKTNFWETVCWPTHYNDHLVCHLLLYSSQSYSQPVVNPPQSFFWCWELAPVYWQQCILYLCLVCSIQQSLSIGELSIDLAEDGAAVIFSCSPGFKLIGNNSIPCTGFDLVEITARCVEGTVVGPNCFLQTYFGHACVMYSCSVSRTTTPSEWNCDRWRNGDCSYVRLPDRVHSARIWGTFVW